MTNPVPSSIKKEGAIPLYMTDLLNQIDTLDSSVYRLVGKIEPVLIPTEPTEEIAETDTHPVILASALLKAIQKIARIRERIEKTVDRVEL